MGSVLELSGDALHKRLIDAANDLCEFVSAALPAEWEITLRMTRGEASLELVTPEGEIEIPDVSDYGVSSVHSLCAYATDCDDDYDVETA